MTSKSKSTNKLPANVYKPTSKEEAAVLRVAERRKKKSNAPGFKFETCEETDAVSVTHDHEDAAVAQALLMDTFATGDYGFYTGLAHQIISLGEQGQRTSARASDFAVSVIRAVDPKDELETMLAVQMAAVHQATMAMARRLTHVDNIHQQDSAERALNKLARTYTTQMQTLKKYRAKAQQTVRVERVTVNEGGQAIVGDVDRGGAAT